MVLNLCTAFDVIYIKLITKIEAKNDSIFVQMIGTIVSTVQ